MAPEVYVAAVAALVIGITKWVQWRRGMRKSHACALTIWEGEIAEWSAFGIEPYYHKMLRVWFKDGPRFDFKHPKLHGPIPGKGMRARVCEHFHLHCEQTLQQRQDTVKVDVVEGLMRRTAETGKTLRDDVRETLQTARELQTENTDNIQALQRQIEGLTSKPQDPVTLSDLADSVKQMRNELEQHRAQAAVTITGQDGSDPTRMMWDSGNPTPWGGSAGGSMF